MDLKESAILKLSFSFLDFCMIFNIFIQVTALLVVEQKLMVHGFLKLLKSILIPGYHRISNLMLKKTYPEELIVWLKNENILTYDFLLLTSLSVLALGVRGILKECSMHHVKMKIRFSRTL